MGRVLWVCGWPTWRCWGGRASAAGWSHGRCCLGPRRSCRSLPPLPSVWYCASPGQHANIDFKIYFNEMRQKGSWQMRQRTVLFYRVGLSFQWLSLCRKKIQTEQNEANRTNRIQRNSEVKLSSVFVEWGYSTLVVFCFLNMPNILCCTPCSLSLSLTLSLSLSLPSSGIPWRALAWPDLCKRSQSSKRPYIRYRFDVTAPITINNAYPAWNL